MRLSPRELGQRAYAQAARGTVRSIDDSHLMQETHADMMHSDSRQGIERAQNYGFSSAILPADENADEAAEAFFSHPSGNRGHPVAVAIDDRRHRPMGLKPGEVFTPYDDQGQGTIARRDFVRTMSLDTAASGDQPEKKRFASLAHVNKQKQPRPKGAAQTAAAQQQQRQDAESFKHEGETVNTEVRCTKERIEFRAGDTVVGYYDVAAGRWVHIGEIRLGSEDANHPVYGVNGGVGKTTKTTGAGAVLVKAPNDGPPTSLDTEP